MSSARSEKSILTAHAFMLNPIFKANINMFYDVNSSDLFHLETPARGHPGNTSSSRSDLPAEGLMAEP